MSLTPTAVELDWKLPGGSHSWAFLSVALALHAVNMQSTARDQSCLSCNIANIANIAGAAIAGVGAVLPAIEHKYEVT